MTSSQDGGAHPLGSARHGTQPHSSPQIRSRIPRLRFELRLILLLILLATCSLLAAVLAAITWRQSVTIRVGMYAGLLAILLWIGRTAFRHIVRPLQTLSNVVAALRENEYSFRAREVGEGDALGDLAAQINELSGDLRIRRHRETETFALLERVVETMDLPVFAFDDAGRLRLTNPAAARMLGQPAETLLHSNAAALGLLNVLRSPDKRVVSFAVDGRQSRWMVRRSKFYQNAIPHTLLLLSDVSGVLRDQERQAWQRLIRVLAHEVNNSLTPIKSIAGSLRLTLQRTYGSAAGDWQAPASTINTVDLEHGLAIIDERAESLNRFLQAYSQLAKLPPPLFSQVAIVPLLQRVCHLERRVPVTLTGDENLEVTADPTQLEHAFINLVRNATDAAMQSNPDAHSAQVQVCCHSDGEFISIQIEDNGPGVTNPANIFIPFYTTKPGGTGIGLVLALQIVEAHGGTLTLANRESAQGCCATVRIPAGPRVAE